MSIVCHLRRFGKQRLHPLPGGIALRYHGDGFASRQHGPYQSHHIGVKRHEFAQSNGALDYQIAAVEQRQPRSKPHQRIQQRQYKGPELHHLEVCLLVLPCHLVKGTVILRVLHKRLEHPDSGYAFLNKIRQLAECRLLFLIPAADGSTIPAAAKQNHQQWNHCQQRQLQVHVYNHFHDHHQRHHHGVKGSQNARTHRHTDGIHIIAEIRHQVAGFMMLEEPVGQSRELFI